MPALDVSAADMALIVIRLAIGCWVMWRVQTPAASGAFAEAGRPSIAVIVPARNEAHGIGALLGSLDVRPGDEVVVVDDHSTDGTAAVAAASGALVVSAPELPEGWTGKTWACKTGFESSAAPTVVFVDADVTFAPGGLDAVAAEHGAHGGLVSVQPFHRPGAPAEHLAMLPNIVGFAGTGAAAPVGPVAGAFGPVMVMSRDDLDAVGGHASVRTSVVEDLALADRFRDAGLPVRVLGGGDRVTFRMYPDGLASIVAGFRKNLAGGARGVRLATVALVVAWSTLLVQAAGWVIRAPVTGAWDASLALYAVVTVQVAWMARRLGSFSPVAWLLFPLSLAVFLLAFGLSAVDVVRGRTTWKGRTISLR